MSVSTRKLTLALWQMLEKAPSEKRTKIIRDFVAMLTKKRLLATAHALLTDLESWAAEQGKFKPNIISRKEDPRVIGGAKISRGFIVVDATVKGRLNKLRQSLISKQSSISTCRI